jgi:tripartite-type tricarboxylate transporter receptor subunit TctC
LRALAIAGSKQTRALPNVPTLAELGIRGAEVTSWFGVLAPHGLPGPITKRLNDELVKILATDEVRDQLFEMGAEPFILPTNEFVKFLDGDIKKWAKLIKDTGIHAD